MKLHYQTKKPQKWNPHKRYLLQKQLLKQRTIANWERRNTFNADDTTQRWRQLWQWVDVLIHEAKVIKLYILRQPDICMYEHTYAHVIIEATIVTDRKIIKQGIMSKMLLIFWYFSKVLRAITFEHLTTM